LRQEEHRTKTYRRGGVAGIRKSRVENGSRRSPARRHDVGGDVAEKKGRFHRKSSHAREEREEGGLAAVAG
jgi:hypothetical protein